MIFESLCLLACRHLDTSSQRLLSVSFLFAVMMLFFATRHRFNFARFRCTVVGPSSLLNASGYVVLLVGIAKVPKVLR